MMIKRINNTKIIAEDDTQLAMLFPPFFMLSPYSMAKP